VPRRRIAGVAGGILRSSRRGPGHDLVGTRPYRPGDDVRAIDHRASARLSAALGRDELVVREHLGEEAARVVVAADTGPSMALFPDGLPWLSKPRAVREVTRILVESALDARCPVGTLDAEGWRPPAGRAALGPSAPLGDGSVPGLLGELAARGAGLSAGTFVFVLSDFLQPPPDTAWAGALGRGWDVVPVVIQDPVWEQSFPPLAGATVPLADETGRSLGAVRLTRREVEDRRRAHEERRVSLLRRFERLGLDAVSIGSHEPGAVLDALRSWSLGRAERRLR
jgi:hypothetical protein